MESPLPEHVQARLHETADGGGAGWFWVGLFGDPGVQSGEHFGLKANGNGRANPGWLGAALFSWCQSFLHQNENPDIIISIEPNGRYQHPPGSNPSHGEKP